MCNLYLGRVPKDDAEREALKDKLFAAVQQNAPLMVQTVAIARSRVDHIKKVYEWDAEPYDAHKPIAFVAGTEERNGVQQPTKIVPQPFLKDEAMATPSSPSEPSASFSKPATARPQWRAKTQAAVPSAIMPNNTTLGNAGQDGHVDHADRDESPARRGAHMTEGERRAAQKASDAAQRTATIAATDAAPRRSVPSANLSGGKPPS